MRGSGEVAARADVHVVVCGVASVALSGGNL